MSAPTARLRPRADERGLATSDPRGIIASTVSAWDEFLAVAAGLDPDVPLRGGTTVRAELAVLGTWPGAPSMSEVAAAAREGRPAQIGTGDGWPPDADLDQLLVALRESREQIAAWPDEDPSWASDGLLPMATKMGPLPILTALHGGSYQLALTALDLTAIGVEAPAALLDRAVDALVDTTGAFAGRAGVKATIAARMPHRTVATGAEGGAWTTIELEPGEEAGPAVIADAATLLRATSGRSDVPSLYRGGDLRLNDVTGLLQWLPVVEQVPGLPGGAALARAGKYLAGVTSLLSKLPFRR